MFEWFYFRDAKEAIQNALGRFGGSAGKKNFLMDDVQCQGTESVLQHCRFAGWGISNCDLASEVAGVVCSPLNTDPLTNPGNLGPNFVFGFVFE